ncbi:MAG: hypothetical protein M1831_002873 [Alyxoria varia]|nr:MAG: hypothetical protein M1831_002873 [Alyxoria varia]
MDHDSTTTATTTTPEAKKSNRSWRFWTILLSLCLVAFISSVDATIVTTALPTIIREIGGVESQYVWIANSFVFASTAPQPLFAQISNIFGRRNPMLVAVSLFMLGSGVAAGARDVPMLIAGRTVQGLGTGGIYVLLDILICDLVPLRERGKYLSIVLSTAAIGVTVGPLIGGALAEANWRWIFYLNLPVAGVALVSIFLFLNVQYTRSPSWARALSRVDLLGNAIFIPSIVALLLGLVQGGVQHPWDSYKIVVPLVLGLLGWAAFHIHQASPLCKEASMPPRIFANRTSAACFLLTFLALMLQQAVAYFLPVYFQGVLGASPLRAGVYFLPFTIAIIPSSIIGGLVMSKTGVYRPLHAASFALTAIGLGLFSLLDDASAKAAWACFQIIAAAGSGVAVSTLLPAILAALPESDVAVATGAFSFVRSFAFVWGVTLPSIIFNGQFNRHAGWIGDAGVRATLDDGAAYEYVSGGYVRGLAGDSKQEVVRVYVEVLRTVWRVGIAFACLGFLCVFVEKHVPLRKELDTEFGLDQGGQKGQNSDDDLGKLEHGEALDQSRVVGVDQGEKESEGSTANRGEDHDDDHAGQDSVQNPTSRDEETTKTV